MGAACYRPIHHLKSIRERRMVRDLSEIMREIESRVKSGEGKDVQEEESPPKVQLPLWPEPVRAVPNGILRSALFGAVGKGRRRYCDAEKLASMGVDIIYTGMRLDQGDLDVWESVLHMVRLNELGVENRLTAYGLLKLMGKTDTGKNRALLSRRLTRLVACAVEVRQGRYAYVGNLIAEAGRDEDTGEWVIQLNPRLRTLFASDQFTQVDWDVRHALDGKPLAQWLHGFYASHAAPYPLRVETLRDLCGSEAGELWKFTQTLRKGLEAVAEANRARGNTFDYEIINGLVYVRKTNTESQKRHLAKNKNQS